MEDELDSGGFRNLLDQALRVEASVDWSAHHINYSQFKKRLKVFAQRRVRIRNMIRESPDGRLSEEALQEAMGPPVLEPDSDGGLDPGCQTMMMTHYVPFEEDVGYSGSSDAESLASSKGT